MALKDSISYTSHRKKIKKLKKGLQAQYIELLDTIVMIMPTKKKCGSY